MRISKTIYLAAALMLALAILTGCASLTPPPKGSPSQLLREGNDLALKAEAIEGRKNQAEAFEAAVKKYNDVVRKDADSPEASQALLAMGKIQIGIPINARPEETLKPKFDTDVQNDYNARETFRRLLTQFNGKRTYQSLVDDYGSINAQVIQDAVDQAQILHEQAGQAIDAENRGKILYKIMDVFVAMTGRIPWFSYWFAIILITVIVKAITTPLTKIQFKSMREMQRLQPLVKQLQEKHKGDQKVLGEKIMALYKEHGINPLAGCLPLLIQMPILFTLYYTIRYYEYQFASGSFLWIGWDALVHKWSIPIMGRPVWLTAANLAQPDLILLVLYTVSMIISQKLSVVDPTQAEQQKMMAIMMPLMFFFIIGYLPSAFVLYWFVYNLLQTWQQYHVIHGAQPVEAPEPTPEPPARVTRRPQGRRRRRR